MSPWVSVIFALPGATTLLDTMFTWYFNGALTDFKKDGSHFEKVGRVSHDNFLMLFTSLMFLSYRNIRDICVPVMFVL